MKIILQECPICDVGDWESMDHLRDHEFWYYKDYMDEGEKLGFKICKNCGFVTYDYQDIETLKERYQRERVTFNPANISTCNRKLEYHKAFLSEIDPNYSVLDFGAAQGYLLDWFVNEHGLSKDNLQGTEWSEAYRKFGIYEYGLNITEDLTDYQRGLHYDLIVYYATLEHMQYPDKELFKAIDMLKADGHIYISVPTFFDQLGNVFTNPVTHLENHYHMNHVSVFTKRSFRNLLKKCGLKIIKEDTDLYGYTVLCKQDKQEFKLEVDDYQEIVEIFKSQKEAIELMNNKDWEGALKAYPKYLDCYINYSINKDNMKSFEAQTEIINRGLNELPGDARLLQQLGNAHYQFDQNNKEQQQFYSNNIKKAEKIFLELLERRPDDKAWYFLGLINGIYKKDYPEAVKYMKNILSINPANFNEPWSWIGKFYKEME